MASTMICHPRPILRQHASSRGMKSHIWIGGTRIRSKMIGRRPVVSSRLPISPQCCWSLEVSLATSVFVAGTAAHLISRNGPRDRGNAAFLGVFGSMQLVDALLWWEEQSGAGLDECSVFNRIITRLAIGIILLEPIGALIGTSMIAKKKPSPLEVFLYSALFLLTPLVGTTYSPAVLSPAPCHAVVQGACMAPHAIGNWGKLLMDVNTPTVCSSRSPAGHLRYGGQDVMYHILHTPLDAVSELPASQATGEPMILRGSEEIPMLLRLAFLLSMAVPYATKVKPTSCGLSHAAILMATWTYGALSDAHASMWCVANVIQGALMLADPLLWPEESDDAALDSAMAGAHHHGHHFGGHRFPVYALAAASSSSSSTQSFDERDFAAAMASSSSSPVMGTSSSNTASSTADAPPKAAPSTSDGSGRRSSSVGTKTRHTIYNKKRVPENLDAIVIGSGIGGLGFASLMAKAGKRVLVLEKHYRPGGCTHAFTEVGNNAFDSGIHYVGGGPAMQGLLAHVVDQGQPIEMAQMGSEADGFLYDRFDLGGPEMVDFHAGRDVLVEGLVSRYPHEEVGIRRYMAAVKKSSRGTDALMMSKFVPPGMPGRKTVARWLENVAWKLGRRTAKDVVAEYVSDPELQALLSGGQLIDWNLSPDKVSWLVTAGMMNYYADGGYYPVGGSNTIPERIIPVIENSGGAVLCKASVDRVLIDPVTGTAQGVVMSNGDEIRAPTVVSGAGYHTTFERLLSPEDLERVGLDLSRGPASTMAPSHSHVCAFVSLDGPPEAFDLKPWNIHSMPELPRYGYDIGKMQEDFYADPLNAQKECLMTLTCPSAKDPLYGEQFPGRSNVLLLVEGMHDWFAHLADAKSDKSTHGRRTDEYKELKEQFEAMFLERLYKYYPLTQGHVTHVELSTPLTAEHFLNASKGASYGLEWTPEHFDPQMHEDWFNPTTKVPGLYLTGEAACFGGFYGALATGYATASHVLGLLPLAWLLLNDKPVDPVFSSAPSTSSSEAPASPPPGGTFAA